MPGRKSFNRTHSFNLRLTERERRALHRLEDLQQLTASDIVRGLIREAAERAGVWPELVKEREADDENDR